MKVEGHPKLERNEDGIIINKDMSGLAKAKARKLAKENKDQEFEDMKADMAEIKGLLKSLMEQKTGN